MSRARRISAALAVTALVVTGGSLVTTSTSSAASFGYRDLNAIQQRHVSGLLSLELNAADRSAALAAPRARGSAAAPAAAVPGFPQQPTSRGCPNRIGDNVKVNQNCQNQSDPDLQGRAQSQNETYAAADPSNPSYLLASYNDYRRGDGTCGVSFSLDGGRTWGDSTVPNSFFRGTFVGKARQYYQAGGDTSVAFDTKGNAYLSCQMFNRGDRVSPNPDQSSALYVFRSTGTHGASWNFPGRPAAELADTTGTGQALLDKQIMAVDNHPGSPYQDRVYVSYTLFAPDGTAYIYLSYSADYGETFSQPVLVSRDSGLCTQTYGLPTPQGRCNENQFSQPFTGPDGALYVTWDNFNNDTSAGLHPDATNAPADNHNQVLLARSTNGGRSFEPPTRVANYYDLPDCFTYQGKDFGRACVPEKGSTQNSYFRATNYPIGAVDPTNARRVVVTFGSYINRNSNENRGCVPTGFSPDTGQNRYDGVKDGGCNNDIVLSESTDGGRHFTGDRTNVRELPVVTDADRQRSTDQFWQATGFTPSGTLAVSYLDRQYGDDETTGYSDVSVTTAARGGAATTRRATSGSMPPPTQFSGLFYGDYTGIAVTAKTVTPVWPDTRTPEEFICGTPPERCTMPAPNAPYANDQEVYATTRPTS